MGGRSIAHGYRATSYFIYIRQQAPELYEKLKDCNEESQFKDVSGGLIGIWGKADDADWYLNYWEGLFSERKTIYGTIDIVL